MRLVIVFLFVAVAAVSKSNDAMSAQGGSVPRAYGFGAASCSTFLADVQLRKQEAMGFYFSWAQGFISASNALLSEGGVNMIKSFTAKFSIEEQQRILLDICGGNRREDFSWAAMKLLDRLRASEGLPPIMGK